MRTTSAHVTIPILIREVRLVGDTAARRTVHAAIVLSPTVARLRTDAP